MEREEAARVVQEEVDMYVDRLARYRRKADKTRDKKGERDIHADRLCEWAEMRLWRLREVHKLLVW